MPNRASYSGKKQIVTIGPAGVMLPLVDLSDADDAIQAEMNEETFLDPSIDLYGEGQHNENSNESGKIMLTIKSSSIADLARLEIYRKLKVTLSVITKDLTTRMAGVVGRNGKIKKAPNYVRGKVGNDPQYVIECINLDITQDGPRIEVV